MKKITLKKVTLLDIKIIHNLFNEAVENNFFITKKKINLRAKKYRNVYKSYLKATMAKQLFGDNALNKW